MSVASRVKLLGGQKLSQISESYEMSAAQT